MLYVSVCILYTYKKKRNRCGNDFCKNILIYIDPELWRVRQDRSNPDKYLVTISGVPDFSWTFIGSLAKVLSTSKGMPGAYGC